MLWLLYYSHTSHNPSQTPCLRWISYAIQKLMLDSCKMAPKQSEAFHTFLWHFFPSLKSEFYCISVLLKSKIAFLKFTSFDNHGFSRVYSNCCCSCSFAPEIIKISQSSHKMYSNKILIFQVSMTILKCLYKKSLETYWRHHTHILYIYIYIYIYVYIYIYIYKFVYIFILLFSEIQSPKGHLNWYIKLIFWKTPIEGEEFF